MKYTREPYRYGVSLLPIRPQPMSSSSTAGSVRYDPRMDGAHCLVKNAEQMK